MNDRLHLILKTKNISASKFADEIGVQRSSISHIVSGRNNPSLEFIQKIIKRFPDISSDWLIFGKGSMYKIQELFNADDSDKAHITKTEKELALSQSVISKDETTINQSETTSETLKKLKKTSADLRNYAKKIERIIIFYSDKTCVEYKIEQNA